MSKVADAGAEALHAALSKPFVGLPFSRALVLSIAMRGSLPAATRSTGSARGHAAEALGLGWLSGFVTRTSVKTWYKDLKKPELVPPNWLFPVAWTTLYIYMGIASYRVYMAQTPRTFDSLALKLYAGQLTLNLLWTPLFFYFKRLRLAMFDIAALWTLIGATAVEFYRHDKVAGWLMAPYFAWVSFASTLNWGVWTLNPEWADGGPKKLD